MSESEIHLQPCTVGSTNMRVYEFGCRIDPESESHAWDQISKARRLYNEMVSRMRGIHAEMSAWVLDRAGPAGKAAQARVDALTEAFDAAKARDDEDAMRRIAADRRVAWRDLAAALKGTRTAYRTEIRDLFLARIGNKTTCDTYQLRCAAVADGLGWGTANDVLDRALQAWQMSMAKGRPPQFARAEERTQDTLTHQFTIKGGLPVEEILGGSRGDVALKIDAEAGRRRYGELRFRLGAATAEICATGTFQYHRAIPAGSFISSARLVRKIIGPRAKWTIQLVTRLPEDATIRSSTPQRKLVAVHFGWAADATGRRVAGIAINGDPGAAHLLHLPESIEADLQRASVVQSQRDKARDEIVPRLKELTLPPSTEQPLVDEVAVLRRLQAQHVSARRLYRLQRMLVQAGLSAPAWLNDWIRQDRKDWQAAVGIARRARLRRRDFYRCTAARLAAQHSAVVIEPLDLAEAALKVDEVTGEKTDFTREARAGRVVASIYEFEKSIREACAKHRTALFELKAPTVQECAHCGSKDTVYSKEQRHVKCSACGEVTDRKLAGAARAWQIASEDIENRIVDFHADMTQKAAQQAIEKAEAQAKMQAARRKPREPEASQQGGEVRAMGKALA